MHHFTHLQHFINNDLESWRGTTRYTMDARPDVRDVRDTWMVRWHIHMQGDERRLCALAAVEMAAGAWL